MFGIAYSLEGVVQSDLVSFSCTGSPFYNVFAGLDEREIPP